MGLNNVPSSDNQRLPFFPSQIAPPQPHMVSTPFRDTLNAAVCNNNNINFSLGSNQYSYYLQSQERLVNSLKYCTLKNNNLLMFGGTDQASCSSSDGSCSQMSYEKEIKKERQIGNCNFTYEETQNINLVDYGNNIIGCGNISQYAQKLNHVDLGNNTQNDQLQYDVEEVKQLISSGSDCTNHHNLFYHDENKTDEREMCYYLGSHLN